MRILIDGESIQARVHCDDGVRLRDMISILRGIGAVVEIAPPGQALDSDVLTARDVVLIPTRSPASEGYSAAELDGIEAFVARGDGLLLMTNHGSTERIPDLTVHDQILAARFGVAIEPSVFCRGRPVRGHEKVPAGGQLRSSLVATRSPRWWPAEVFAPR